jgi:hypothetical protein
MHAALLAGVRRSMGRSEGEQPVGLQRALEHV